MPRFVIRPASRSSGHEGLVKKLIAEFNASSANLQPLILEEHIPATGSRHVRVIWDRWKGIDDEQRSEAITEAYARNEGTEAAANITIAEGVTPQEALALGWLPFKVVPLPKKGDSLRLAAYQEAQEKEKRSALLGTKARELRYARIEDAEQAAERLKQAVPGSSWTVVQELATES